MNIMIKTTQGLCESVEQEIIKQKQKQIHSLVCWSINSLVGGIV
jgi:hypothetical protein